MPLQCNGFEVVAFAWVSLLTERPHAEGKERK